MKKSDGGDVVLTRAKGVISRHNPDGTIVLMKLNDLDRFFKIDGIAARIWLLIDGKRSLASIKSTIIKNYNPPRARFEKDLAGLLKKLQKYRIIKM